MQPREAGNFAVFEQLAFELERCLFRRKQDERRAIGFSGERSTHFGKAAKSFSAASGAEQEARLHGGSFHAKAQRRKGIYSSSKNCSFGFADALVWTGYNL